MKKTVIGTTNNAVFDVVVGRKCNILKHFFYNGEGWYMLEDVTTKEKFESPDIFWE